MAEFVFAFPGDLATPTGGYAYDRRLAVELLACGWNAELLSFGGAYPNPTAQDLTDAAARLAVLTTDAIVLADGLLFGALPASLLAQTACRFVALVHHPLAYETGLSAEDTTRLWASEHEALVHAKAVLTTSASTAELLHREYEVPTDRLAVAMPGQDPVARASANNDVPTILSVGALVPRKSYRLLIEALSGLKDLEWRCRIVGPLDRDDGEATAVWKAIRRHGLEGRVELTGPADDDRLATEYSGADLYVSSASYEGYGMALSAALAYGLPIVACAGGAVADTLPNGSALLVPVGDMTALRDAIRRMLRNRIARRSYANAAKKASSSLPRWSDSARIVAAVFERI